MKKKYISSLMLIMLLGAVSESYSIDYVRRWREYVPSMPSYMQKYAPWKLGATGAALVGTLGYGAGRYIGYPERMALLGLLLGGSLGGYGGYAYDESVKRARDQEEKRARDQEEKRREDRRQALNRERNPPRENLWGPVVEGAREEIRQGQLQLAKNRVIGGIQGLQAISMEAPYVNFFNQLRYLVNRVYDPKQLETFLYKFDEKASSSKNLIEIKNLLGKELDPQNLEGVLALVKNLHKGKQYLTLQGYLNGLPEGAMRDLIEDMIGLFGYGKVVNMLVNDVSTEEEFNSHLYTHAIRKHNKSTKKLVKGLINWHQRADVIRGDFIEENKNKIYEDILIDALLDFEIFKVDKVDSGKIVFNDEAALYADKQPITNRIIAFLREITNIIKPENERFEYLKAINDRLKDFINKDEALEQSQINDLKSRFNDLLEDLTLDYTFRKSRKFSRRPYKKKG